MIAYTTKDCFGNESTHFATNEANAISAHIQHFGLIYLDQDPIITKKEEIPKSLKKYMKHICNDRECKYIAMYKPNK